VYCNVLKTNGTIHLPSAQAAAAKAACGRPSNWQNGSGSNCERRKNGQMNNEDLNARGESLKNATQKARREIWKAWITMEELEATSQESARFKNKRKKVKQPN
jgi:hypothetical protein